ncbi:MAG: hypothetical protein AAF919_13975 [Pseudomonadota bacterium]
MSTMRSQRPTLVPLLPQGIASDRLVPGILRLSKLLDLLDTEADVFGRLLDLADHAMHDTSETAMEGLAEAALDDAAFARLLADRIVPDLARRLGDEWERDSLSFADVTIAAARLQTLMRRIAPGPELAKRGDGGIVLIVPPWEQHTLPGSLATTWMRRRGIDVRPCMGFDADVVARMASHGRIQGFFVSVGSSQSLERLPDYLRRLRRALTRVRPIIIGGPAVDGSVRHPQRYGGDAFASGIEDALEKCGVLVPCSGDHGPLPRIER